MEKVKPITNKMAVKQKIIFQFDCNEKKNANNTVVDINKSICILEYSKYTFRDMKSEKTILI